MTTSNSPLPTSPMATTPSKPIDVPTPPKSHPMSPSSPITSDAEQLILENMTVRIQKRPPASATEQEPTYETVKLSTLTLPVDPTLEDIRTALTQCELGDAKRDIFFPAWTKSLYVAVDGVEQTIESDAQLRQVLAHELESSGSVVLQLQECRNARYSRRKRTTRRRGTDYALNAAAAAAAAAAANVPMFIPPAMYMMGDTGRADQPVYFDRPMAYYHPYNIGGEVTFLPPPFIVPFQMYSTPTAVAPTNAPVAPVNVNVNSTTTPTTTTSSAESKEEE